MAWLLAIVVAVTQVAGPWLCRCHTPTPPVTATETAPAAPACPHCKPPAPAPAESPDKPAEPGCPDGPRSCCAVGELVPATVEPLTELQAATGVAAEFTLALPWAIGGCCESAPATSPRPHPYWTAATRLYVHHVLRC